MHPVHSSHRSGAVLGAEDVDGSGAGGRDGGAEDDAARVVGVGRGPGGGGREEVDVDEGARGVDGGEVHEGHRAMD